MMDENQENKEDHNDHGGKKLKIMSSKLARKRLEVSRDWKAGDVPISHFVALLEEVVATLEYYEGKLKE